MATLKQVLKQASKILTKIKWIGCKVLGPLMQLVVANVPAHRCIQPLHMVIFLHNLIF